MNVLIKPVITEKATKNSEILSQYTFIVNKKANKLEIKKAIKDLYNVEVLSVNTSINRVNRAVKYTKSGMVEARTGAYKKAVVTIPSGEVIEF